MSQYTPNTWVVLKLTQHIKTGNTGYGRKEQVLYKVLAGWSGGYLDGNSWRMNSGITEVTEADSYYEFHGSSGSRYQCFKESYRLSMSTVGMYKELKDRFDDGVEIMPENTKWSEIDW